MSRPGFLEALEKTAQKGMSRFYMPGHKGQFAHAPRLNAIAPFDFTELTETDSLFDPTGIIRNLEGEIAGLYGAKASFLSCGGATLCIQTMLSLVAGVGQKVVMARGVHGAALNSAALLGFEPIWVYPKPDAGPGLPGRVSPGQIEETLAKHPEAVAVYVTSPDYYGVCLDLPGIAAVCQGHKVPLLVDNAHGAHLPFVAGIHPMAAGAAMCADSAHKTLAAFTGTAFLHLGDSRYQNQVKGRMALFGSTSPSYLMMASAAYAIDDLKKGGRRNYARLAQWVILHRRQYETLGFSFPQGKTDPMRLAISAKRRGFGGEELAAYFRQKQIEPEAVMGDMVILLPTPYNEESDLDRLNQGIIDLPFKGFFPETAPLPGWEMPIKRMGVRQAVFAPGETVSVAKAVGRIAGENLSPCPPGIPRVVAGEEISAADGEFLKAAGLFAIKVVK